MREQATAVVLVIVVSRVIDRRNITGNPLEVLRTQGKERRDKVVVVVNSAGVLAVCSATVGISDCVVVRRDGNEVMRSSNGRSTTTITFGVSTKLVIVVLAQDENLVIRRLMRGMRVVIVRRSVQDIVVDRSKGDDIRVDRNRDMRITKAVGIRVFPQRYREDTTFRTYPLRRNSPIVSFVHNEVFNEIAIQTV